MFGSISLYDLGDERRCGKMIVQTEVCPTDPTRTENRYYSQMRDSSVISFPRRGGYRSFGLVGNQPLWRFGFARQTQLGQPQSALSTLRFASRNHAIRNLRTTTANAR